MLGVKRHCLLRGAGRGALSGVGKAHESSHKKAKRSFALLPQSGAIVALQRNNAKGVKDAT